jgi:hypothetical protein
MLFLVKSGALLQMKRLSIIYAPIVAACHILYSSDLLWIFVGYREDC